MVSSRNAVCLLGVRGKRPQKVLSPGVMRAGVTAQNTDRDNDGYHLHLPLALRYRHKEEMRGRLSPQAPTPQVECDACGGEGRRRYLPRQLRPSREGIAKVSPAPPR